MYLSKLILDSRHPQARRDLADAYEMHRTLARAFAPNDDAPPERFLWRLEYDSRPDADERATVLVHSAIPGNWYALRDISSYAPGLHGNKFVDLDKLLQAERRFHFRLTANPTVTRAGKRYGLVREDEQLIWLARQGERNGFRALEVTRSASAHMSVKQGKTGRRITVQTALFDGVLQITDRNALRQALLGGIGHAKVLGLGMLSLAPG